MYQTFSGPHLVVPIPINNLHHLRHQLQCFCGVLLASAIFCWDHWRDQFQSAQGFKFPQLYVELSAQFLISVSLFCVFLSRLRLYLKTRLSEKPCSCIVWTLITGLSSQQRNWIIGSSLSLPTVGLACIALQRLHHWWGQDQYYKVVSDHRTASSTALFRACWLSMLILNKREENPKHWYNLDPMNHILWP